MSSDNEKNALFLEASTEEDQRTIEKVDQVPKEEPLRLQEFIREEKDKERKEKRSYSAFNLILYCLGGLLVIYTIDIWIDINFNKTSQFTKDIIEIIKTLLFTLSGYLFARKSDENS